MRRFASLAVLSLVGSAAFVSAEPPPSYARQVKPLLAKYCLECHNADEARGDFNLSTFKGLLQGGDKGPALVPGKPDESILVLQAEKKQKPFMPPAKATQPKPDEIAILRAWVAAGAKDDSSTATVTLPSIQPRRPAAPPVNALAYRPDGKLLAAGGHREVMLLDPARGEVVGKLLGQSTTVTALAFSRDGQRLAVASGSTGSAAAVRLYSQANGQLQPKPDQVIAAHADIIHDLAFSPDGKLLASCGYDRLVKLWDVTTGKEVRTLKDHSDTIYGLAFSPDGKLLASAAADRAVKIWDVNSGVRLYTLGDSTDWVYAVAWSPDGRHVAAAGVDRSIRVWEADANGGKLVHSVFAHERSVLRLVYASDGKTLYSLGEDRIVKSWDTARMIERRVYDAQPESALSLALRSDSKQLAVGRYDGALVLLEEPTGKVQSQPLPAKPKPPQLNKLSPTSAQRGQTVRITFEGKDLDSVTEITSSSPDVTSKVLADTPTAGTIQADVTFPAGTIAGQHKLGLKGPGGQTAQLTVTLHRFPLVPKKSGNYPTGQPIVLPATVSGALDRAGAIDFYRFEAKAGQQVGVQAIPDDPTKLDPILQLQTAAGEVLAQGTGALGHTCERAGVCILSIRDRDYRAGTLGYHLDIGEVPVVTAFFPLGLKRGTEASISLQGVHLGEIASVQMKAPADAPTDAKLPLPIITPLGPPVGSPRVVVGEFPEVVRDAKASSDHPMELPVPGTGNGRIVQPGASDLWKFTAKKGQRLIVEVNARRLGSPLDSYIEILDPKDQPVPRAVLRCLARVFTTFRDHDSATPGIRLETWNELAMNDYVLLGNELLRIAQLPLNPDADCQFFSLNGQRIGYLDTTPTHHSNGTPLYRVAIHPPGTTFPPNGLPVVPIWYRNDDGGPGYGKDSRLFFDPPADGEYRVRIRDSRGEGGSQYAYRLTIRPPQLNYQVSFTPTTPDVPKGGARRITVTADRSDGFDDPIELRLENLPPGFSAPPTSIPAGENSTSFALWADSTAALPKDAPPIKLIARAKINGQEKVREIVGGVPKLTDLGDIVTTTEQSAVTVKPGQSVWLKVKIERRNGFTGRVPMDVRGLPHGVRVLDVGLNGILITPQESSRMVEIYCEPWVEPTEHPFVVFARQEGKGTEHVAKSVLLKVDKK